MDKLYAPWRDCYVKDHVKNNRNCQGRCIFCDVFVDDVNIEQKFILHRQDDLAVMLNLYPYNGGHLLVFPKNHSSELYTLSELVLQDLMKVAAISMRLVKEQLGCQAINFGANIGRFAGAGIPEHVHMHIVPRWGGDTGFMPVIAQTKQVSVNLHNVYAQLKPLFDNEFAK